jgi:hypothetical protein
MMIKTPQTEAKRFISKVKKDSNGCWVYQGSSDTGGYGVFTSSKQRYAAHRYSWELFNGPIKKGLQVLHKCDNPICVNPDHLFLGTPQDNMLDKTNKLRQYRGIGHHSAIMTSDFIEAVVNEAKTAKSISALARKLKTTPRTINKALIKAFVLGFDRI